MENASCTPMEITGSVLTTSSCPEEYKTDMQQEGVVQNQGLLWNSGNQPGVRPFNYGGGAILGSFSELLMNASTGMMQFGDHQSPGCLLSAVEMAGQFGDTQKQCDGVGCGEYEQVDGTLHTDDDGYLGADDSENDTSDDEACFDGSALVCDDNTESDSSDSDDLHDSCVETNNSPLTDCEQEVTVDDVDDIPEGDHNLLSESSDSEEEITVEVDLAQEFYTNKAQEGVPYKKRKRLPKGWKRPNFRTPRAMGAVERALRNATKHNAGRVFEPKLGMVFDSTNEAKEFYNMYGWEMGFGVKFNCSRPTGGRRIDGDGSENYISMQEIVCQRSGHDSRITTGTKRCGCPAKIRLLRTEDYGWYISAFVKDHNHLKK